jgi:hypothetical protein
VIVKSSVQLKPAVSKKTRQNLSFSHETKPHNARTILVDSTQDDLFAIPAPNKGIIWDSAEEQIYTLQNFTAGSTKNSSENALIDVYFVNKISEAAEFYFSVTPVSLRTDIVQSHLKPIVHIPPAVSATEPSVTYVGRIARRLGFFAFFWGVVVVPLPSGSDRPDVNSL